MKKISAILPLLLFSISSYSQLHYGLVGGANFQASGDLKSSLGDVTNFTETAQRKTGYYLGAYGQINFLAIYLRPEIHFTQLNSDFENFSFSSSNLEAPISVGYKILPPLSLFAGPSFQYRMQGDSSISINSIGDQTTMGAHLGARLHLGKIGVDLRYERGLTESEISFLTNEGIQSKFDARGQKWSLGVSYSLD